MASRRTTRFDRELGRSTMNAGIRSAAGSRLATIRQPPVRSSSMKPPSSSSAARGILDRAGATSPADSISTATTGTKRKERDYESEVGGSVSGGSGGSEETNINVVVRCRGRNQREIKENSTVVVQADGVKGKAVGLMLGPNSLSNKSYTFDRVYSPAADQNMVFDDTVKPILDEVCLLTHSPPTHPGGRVDPRRLTRIPDARRIQLYHLCLRPDRYGKDIHHVWRYE